MMCSQFRVEDDWSCKLAVPLNKTSQSAMSLIFSARHFVLVVGSNSDSREVVSFGAASILDCL
jgi:hypothetical protein